MRDTTMSLSDFFEKIYLPWHLGLSKGAADQYRYTINSVQKILKRTVLISEFSEDLFVPYLSKLSKKLSPATVNSKRDSLLTLWRFAHKKDYAPAPTELPEMKEPKRIPSSWSLAEFEKLLEGCKKAKEFPGWHREDWVALILTAYDTLHRVSCLLDANYEQLDWENGRLMLMAEQVKQHADISHRLHPQTLDAIRHAIARNSDRSKLFPWPFHKRKIWVEYNKILIAAGLPHDRRSKFHRIRRTSYTAVYATLGKQAATEQAGHSCDLSRRYLDTTKLPTRMASDVIPRPKFETRSSKNVNES